MEKGQLIQPIKLRKGEYYLLINVAKKKALALPPTDNPYKQSLILQQPNEGQIRQVWMIEEIHPKKWEIVHAQSALVLTNDKKELKLEVGKWKSSQFYFPKCRVGSDNEIWLYESEDSLKMINFNQKLACNEIDYSNETAIWRLVPVRRNPIINKSCILEFAYSTQVIDVPEASDKSQIALVQYPLNNRFNQRWYIEKFNQHYRIQNLKTRQFLQISSTNPKPGTSVIQNKQNGKEKQLWHIQYIGKNLYIIQPDLNRSLYLSVASGNYFKECAQINLSTERNCSCWRIVGYIPV